VSEFRTRTSSAPLLQHADGPVLQGACQLELGQRVSFSNGARYGSISRGALSGARDRPSAGSPGLARALDQSATSSGRPCGLRGYRSAPPRGRSARSRRRSRRPAAWCSAARWWCRVSSARRYRRRGGTRAGQGATRLYSIDEEAVVADTGAHAAMLCAQPGGCRVSNPAADVRGPRRAIVGSERGVRDCHRSCKAQRSARSMRSSGAPGASHLVSARFI
jgi:hypothetical protein